MIKSQWNADRVVQAILSLGYQRVPGPSTTLWFMSPQSSPEVGQFLVLEHKPRVNAYAVHFGVSSRLARNSIAEVEYLLRTTSLTRWPAADTPCWTLFNAGRALKWGYFAIPDPTGATAGAAQFAALCEAILSPMLEKVVTSEGVLNTLLRSEIPFEWGVTNPVTRATEVIANSMVEGIDLEVCRIKLMKFQPALHAGMRAGPVWANTISVLTDILGR